MVSSEGSVSQQQQQHASDDSQAGEGIFRSIIDNAPVATCLFVGREMRVAVANDIMLGYWGKDRSIIGLPLAEGVPELIGQPFLDILDDVFTTGTTYESVGTPAQLAHNGELGTYYFNFTYKPLLNGSGEVYAIMDMAIDVTEEVLAKQSLEEEQQRTKMAVELSGVGVYEVDWQTDRITASERFYEIFDGNRFSTAAAYRELIVARDANIQAGALNNLLSGGNYDYEARVTVNGSLKWIRSTARLLRDNDSQPLKLVGLVQDITVQKSFETSLAEEVSKRTAELQETRLFLEKSNAYLQLMLDNFETAFAALSPIFKEDKITDFRFNKTNEAYSAYSRRPPLEIENIPVSEVFPGYYQTEAFEKYVDTFLTGKEHDWELHYNVDGLDVHLKIISRKVGNEVIVQFTDFTRLKNLELELLRKINELESSNRNLEEFAYAASHDLKEPIRKVLYFSDLLNQTLDERLTSKEREYFSRMKGAGERMFALVEDLLTYSQVNLQPAEPEKVSLYEVVALVLTDLDLDIQQKEATIEVRTLPEIRGHNRQLQQAFQNLIANSLKYCPPQRKPEVLITGKTVEGKDIPLALTLSQLQQSYYRVTVTDNGIGFPESGAGRIFDLFTRLHGAETASGTGIGLAIVRKVLENHNGLVQAESIEGAGSSFHLYFPISA